LHDAPSLLLTGPLESEIDATPEYSLPSPGAIGPVAEQA
jgi:hypothetical protein